MGRWLKGRARERKTSVCYEGAERKGDEQRKVVMFLDGVWSCVSAKAAGFERRITWSCEDAL